MLEKDSIRAKQLVALGAVLVFCVAIVVLSLFPFYVSPLAARYRAGDYDWKDDECGGAALAVVLCHRYWQEILIGTSLLLLAGGALIGQGHSLWVDEPVYAPCRSFWDDSVKPPEPEPPTCRQLVCTAVHRQYVPWDMAVTVFCGLITVMSFSQRTQSFMLSILGMTSSLLFAVLTLHQWTSRIILMECGRALIVAQRSIFWSKECRFDPVESVSLGKHVRNHGGVEVQLDTVRREFDSHGTYPRVDGIVVSGDGKAEYVPVSLPFRELMLFAESLKSLYVGEPERLSCSPE